MKLLLQKRIVFLLCIVGFVLWAWGTNDPFVGIYNANNNYLSLAARNYLRFGFTTLKFFPTYFAGAHFMPYNPYYLHHPILVFLAEAVSLMIFGFHNWTVHIPQFFFTIASMAMVYAIAKKLWGEKIALWSFGLAILFPMTGFFWKYMMFEQASLFFALCMYYFIFRYVQHVGKHNLLGIFVCTLLAGFSDWGVLYLVFPLAIFLFTKYKKDVRVILATYGAAVVISLGLFMAAVFVLGSYGDLVKAIWNRSFASELTALSYWPARLVAISMLRTFIYFTPFAFVSGIYILKLIRDRQTLKLPEYTLVFFFLFGVLNLVFLPTATWGHSYFLYYFIPFFAWTGGIWLERREKKPWVIGFWLIVILATSITVNYFKIQQVRKQVWKYDAAKAINSRLVPYETVGVVNFAGDVFENYFFHPTQPIPFDQITSWTTGVSYPGVARAVFTCADVCTAEEMQLLALLRQTSIVETYSIGGHTAWFITKEFHHVAPAGVVSVPSATIPTTGSIILRMYRMIRDALNVGQI